MTAANPLRAYEVQEDFEQNGGVYFARHAIEARRVGASEHNDGELRGMTCRRAPWADRYAPGPVPKLAMLGAGWWFECSGCTQRIDDGGEDDDGEQMAPVEIGDAIYCSPTCRHQDLEDRAARKIGELAAIQEMRARLWARRPGVTFLGGDHAYINRHDGELEVRQVIVWFTFPGATVGRCTYRSDKVGEDPEVWLARADEQAWNAWCDQLDRAAAP